MQRRRTIELELDCFEFDGTLASLDGALRPGELAGVIVRLPSGVEHTIRLGDSAHRYPNGELGVMSELARDLRTEPIEDEPAAS